MNRINALQWMFVIAAILSAFQLIYAGAWTQKKQSYYLKVASGYHYATTEFDHLGNERNILADFSDTFQNTEYEEFSIKSYFEYGLFSRITVIAEVPFKIATSSRTEISNYFEGGRRDTSHTTSGFGDLKLQGRWGILDGPVVFSLQPGVKIPLYSTSTEQTGPRLGTGDVDFDAGALFGASFAPSPLYFSSEGGYRFRTGPLHDEVYLNAEIGLSFEKTFFKAEFRGLKNTTTPPDVYGGPIELPLPGGGGAVPDRLFGDQDFIKLVGEGVYKFGNRWGISGEVIHTLAGKNIITGTTFQLGVVMLR